MLDGGVWTIVVAGVQVEIATGIDAVRSICIGTLEIGEDAGMLVPGSTKLAGSPFGANGIQCAPDWNAQMPLYDQPPSNGTESTLHALTRQLPDVIEYQALPDIID